MDPVKTICCATNRKNPPGSDIGDNFNWTADECLMNGICRNRRVDKGTKITEYWLNYCTDKDYSSGKCLDICRAQRGEGGATRMTPCDSTNPANSTRWCCGDSTSCCTNAIGYVELPKSFVGHAISSTTTSTGTSSTTSSASSSSSSAPSQTPAPSGDSGLTTGAKAGIGVGVSAAAIALVGAAFFLRKAYGWKKQAKEPKPAELAFSPSTAYTPVGTTDQIKYRNDGSVFAPSEIDSRPVAMAPSEMGVASPINSSPTELPASGPILPQHLR